MGSWSGVLVVFKEVLTVSVVVDEISGFLVVVSLFLHEPSYSTPTFLSFLQL